MIYKGMQLGKPAMPYAVLHNAFLGWHFFGVFDCLSFFEMCKTLTFMLLSVLVGKPPIIVQNMGHAA